MKKLVLILATMMALMSCDKTLTIDFADKKDDVEKIEFTNTITRNGVVLPITELRIDVEEDGYEYYGYNEPIFDIYCEARKLINETSNDDYNYYCSEYIAVFVGGYIPASNMGKMYNLNDKNTRGLFGFGKSHVIKGQSGYSLINKVDDVEEIVYGYCDGNKGYFNSEDGTLINKKAPKTAKYYIDIERTYKEFYKVYIEFEDTDGNQYILSYKGEKRYKD